MEFPRVWASKTEDLEALQQKLERKVVRRYRRETTQDDVICPSVLSHFLGKFH